jgi:hypothetical protein
VVQKEARRILKYKVLTIEVQYMWDLQTNVIPIIMGATETILKSFTKYLSNIP